MIRIGLTGGIGSGKSVVASLFTICNIPVYIADIESKKLTNTSPVIRSKLIELFGEEIYNKEGVNKKLLASYIFGNEEYLKQVNAIIHPEVNRHFQQWVSRQTTDICVIETAILFESGFDKGVDVSVMVYAPKELRVERASSRDGISNEDVIRRIDSQMPDEIKKEKSDYILWNDDRQALIPQVTGLLTTLRSRYS